MAESQPSPRMTRRRFVAAAARGSGLLAVGPVASQAAAARGEKVSVEDWRQAGEGWIVPAKAITETGTLRLVHSGGDTAPPAEAAFTDPPLIRGPYALRVRMRFHKLGLGDDGTGNASHFQIHVGPLGGAGGEGLILRFNQDRYNPTPASKTYRTDTEWHDWDFLADPAAGTIRLERDAEYVSLHKTGAEIPPGIRLIATGSPDVAADVEIGRFTVQPAEREPPLPVATMRPRMRQPEPGDWPLWRRDVRNSGHSPLKGNIRTPRIAWKHDLGGRAAVPEFADLDGDGSMEALTLLAGRIEAWKLDGTTLWEQRIENATILACEDVDGDGERELLLSAGVPSQFHALNAKTGKIRYVCPHQRMSGVAAARVAKFDPHKQGLQALCWSHTNPLAFVVSFEDGVERAKIDCSLNWKKDFFTPTVAIADMDGDGTPEAVFATYSEIFAFDCRTGAAKMDLEWHVGRCYGTLVLKDVDGDGFPDVVVLADVLREHIGVAKNEGGKSLKGIWDKFYEQNYPEDHVSLRVLNESVDDFDGDGKTEIAWSAFDDRTDKRWHTLVVDALTGETKHDIPDRLLVSAGTLYADGPPALLLSRPESRKTLREDRLESWTGAGGKWAMREALPPGRIAWHPTIRDFAPNCWSQVSGIATGLPSPRIRTDANGSWLPLVREDADGKVAEALEFRPGAEVGKTAVTLLKNAYGLPPGRLADVRDDFTTRKVRTALLAGDDGKFRLVNASGKTVAEKPTRVASPVIPLVARLSGGNTPRVFVFDAGGRLQCMEPSKSGPPKRRWTAEGSGIWSYYISNSRPQGFPSLEDVDGDGQYEVLLARKPGLLVALGADGKEKRRWEFPAPPAQWMVGNLDGDEYPDLVVTYPMGAILDVRTVAISGASGKRLWMTRASNGPLALHDIDGDGRDEVVTRDLYERRTLRGPTGRDVQPISMEPGYHTAVIPESAAGNTRLWWLGGGWAMMGEDSAGKRRWHRWFIPSGHQAIADVDGDGRLEVGGVSAGQVFDIAGGFKPIESPDREFVCVDAETGDEKWRWAVGATATGVVSADVDGDGKPEFVFGAADGRLIALRGGPKPAPAWTLSLPASMGTPVICDCDGDGKMEILVSCADGNLYCVKG